jgi:hypothetical protein
MQRLVLAAMLFGTLEIGSFGAVLAIARAAPSTSAPEPQASASVSGLRDCVQYVIANTPVLRCPGG